MGGHKPSVSELARILEGHPMPLEGGLFRQTWRGPAGPDGRPVGTSILVLLSPELGMFSAMHRLPTDEVWHFHLGDRLEMLLLRPDGSWGIEILGNDVLAGEHLQLTVQAGVWMGARVAEGGSWTLFGATMAPGFLAPDYEGGEVGDLCRTYPGAAGMIRALCRPGAPLRHTVETRVPGCGL